MKLYEYLLQDLKIDKHYVKPHRTNDNIAICMVHEHWLQKLLSTYEVPAEFSKQETLSDLECKFILAHPTNLKPPWKLISVYHILKKSGHVARFPKIQQQSKDLSHQNLTYSQLLHYITETNFKNLWKEAHKKHSKGIIHERKDDVHIKVQEFNDAIRESVKRIYNCPIISVVSRENAEKETESFDINGAPCNILGAYCLIESASSFYLLQPHLQHTLHDCLTFSPAIFGNSYCKPLFVIYQLLQGLRDIHDTGLFIGDFSLHDVGVDQNLWVQINPRLWEFLKQEVNYNVQIGRDNEHFLISSSDQNSSLNSKSSKPFSCQQEPISNPEIYLNILVENWMHGEISNFDYLMELNYLSGRRLGNPNNHPVLPWIMDFTSPSGGWRDLSKSKYRLNKGDRQLDMMFEMLPSASSTADLLQIPHHVCDVLTDITYFVYMARRIPRTVLCQHVRRNWVPAEYPSSMQRMQEWTPDECIPEFFTDPSVFVSIHEDLPDLEIPCWAKDPEDFINKHKAALESDHVSERLHNWIDLTFGYKLSGAAAVKSKNVCLHLVDQHTNLSNSGMVQLFQQPHPHKLMMSSYHSKHPPKLHRHLQAKDTQKKDKHVEEMLLINKDNEEDPFQPEAQTKIFPKQRSFKGKNSEIKLGSETKMESHPELQPILLPKDYNPLLSLNQLETLYNFTAKTMFRVSDHLETQNVSNPHALHQRKIRDMISFACVVVEIFLENRLRCLHSSTSLEERYEFISKLLKTDFFELPRCIRHVSKLILQFESLDDNKNSPRRTGLPLRYPAITKDGLPPPSAHQLLQPLVRLFPFPSYFQKLYTFLSEVKEYKDTMTLIENMNITLEGKNDLIGKLCESLVKRTAKILPELLSLLTPEAIDIIVPYLQEMFDNHLTNVLAAWYLFDPISQVLGPQQTKKTFLVSLIRLYDCETFAAKSLKLFHRSYLLQLIIRLGLHTFLTHFITRLIEAVGGYKDAPNDSIRNDYLDGACNSSPLRSPSLEVKNHDIFENMSPYDDDLSQNEGLNVSSKSDVETTDVEPETEPEMFVFEAVTDDLNADNTDVFFADHLDQKFESSDSADAASLGEAPVECDRSPDPSEDIQAGNNLDVSDTCAAIPSSVPHSFTDAKTDKNVGETVNLCSSSVPSNVNSMFTTSKTDDESETVKKSQLLLSPSNKSDTLRTSEYSVSDVAMESINWLSFRLGPVLTAKYLSRNLLRMLSLCYYGKEQILFTNAKETLDESISISHKVIVGDLHVMKVLECLASIAALYGEHIILLQYLPHITDLIMACKRKITPNFEAGLIGSMMLLKYIIPFLSDKTLMDNLQDVLIQNILNPTVRLISSQRLSFPNKGQAREVIAFKLLDVLHLIGLRIGFEMTRQHLTSVLCRFFASFERVHNPHKQNFNLSAEITTVTRSPDEYYLMIKKDETTNEYSIGTPINVKDIKNFNNEEMDQTESLDDQSIQKNDVLEELKQIFTPEMAYTAYVPFCRLAGSIHMEQSLINEELIRNLCSQYDKEMNGVPEGSDMSATNSKIGLKMLSGTDSSWKDDESVVSGSFGKNVAMIGNRIDIQLDDEIVVASEMPVISSPPGESSKLADFPRYNISKLISKKMENNQRHLRGSWLAYWEHEIGRNEKDLRFNFKQIKLQTFSGHTNTIKAIHCFDNENSFISASKDKSVKLWSLRSHGDGSAHSSCQWTYSNHKKSVFAVTFLESMRLIGSCDSAVHLWDPFMGSCIKQFDSTKNSPVTVLAAMPAPSPVLIAGTTEATIRFLDARLLKYIHEYKVSIGPAGLIRCITVSPDGHWLAVGHSSGVISILDVRTGLMTGSWKGHEGEILQIKAFDNSIFVTSSLDHCISVWNVDDGKLQCHLRGPTEPVHCLNFYKNEMISVTTANRIGIHTSVDNLASFSSTRLRSETFKGVVTSLTVLPLNRLLLLGADNGMIRLLC